jgi:rRNA maturation protein Nop10
MFEKCTNCGGRVLKGFRDERGLFCSPECQSFAAHPGFCPACLAVTTDKSSGGTYTLNGIGTTLYGQKDPCTVCGAVTKTHWVTLVFVPAIPLGKYRVKYIQPHRFLSRKLAA